MKIFNFSKKMFFILILAVICFSGLFAEEVEQKGGIDFSYRIGGEYTFAMDLPKYSGIPLYDKWQTDIIKISPKFLDPLGKKGQLFRFVNVFEWKWDNNVSITAFANLTLNYIPAFFENSIIWVPACWKGAMTCFNACLKIMNWALSDGWLLVNVCSLFVMPITGILVCGLGGIFCLIGVPASIVCLAGPMITVGGSIDYHLFTNEIVDTKMSLGLEVDGYRALFHMGFTGLFVQGEVSCNIQSIKLYAQAGYRVDLVNVVSAVQTNNGNVGKGGEGKYVPAPYIRAGVSYKIKT